MYYKEVRRTLKRTIRHKPYVVDEATIELVAHLEPNETEPEAFAAICQEMNDDLRILMEEEVAYLKQAHEEDEDARKQKNKDQQR